MSKNGLFRIIFQNKQSDGVWHDLNLNNDVWSKIPEMYTCTN